MWGPSLEHVIPLAAGGSRRDPANLRLSHAYPCNNEEKAAMHGGVDYAAPPVRTRCMPSILRGSLRRPAMADPDFESWSAARM